MRKLKNKILKITEKKLKKFLRIKENFKYSWTYKQTHHHHHHPTTTTEHY